jgi:ABC-type dipeptide/oligopeptide/nickel transport system permease subunit
VLLAVLAPVMLHDPLAVNLNLRHTRRSGWRGGAAYPWDRSVGLDILSRLIWGGRISLT